MWSPRSLAAISEYEDSGLRLEVGLRRVLHLRFACLNFDKASWRSLGLPYLDFLDIPFPNTRLTQSFPFPKVTKNGTKNIKDVIRFFDAVHRRLPPEKDEVNPLLLDHILSQMLMGQYYQGLPKSGGADSIMRIGDKIALYFQCNNTKRVTAEQVSEEVGKCIAQGWTIYLVVVCSQGHNVVNAPGLLEELDMTYEDRGVNVVLLSALSVSMFLGAANLTAMASSSLVVDSQSRLPSSI